MLKSFVLTALTLLLLAEGISCHSESNQGLMSSGKNQPSVLHSDLAANPDEFRKIIRLPVRQLFARLGPFRIEETSFLQVTLGSKAVETLGETIALEMDRVGRWHGLKDNSRDSGVEVWRLKDQVAVKMRYGKAVLRRPETGEEERLLELIAGAPGADYDLVERFAALHDAGTTSAEGRPVRQVRIDLLEEPRPPRHDPGRADPNRAWRANLTVSDLNGRAIIDVQTGVLLALELRARYLFPKGDTQAKAQLTLRRVLHLGEQTAIAAPEGAIASPTRTRYEVEKKELLEGLVQEKRGTSTGRRR